MARTPCLSTQAAQHDDSEVEDDGGPGFDAADVGGMGEGEDDDDEDEREGRSSNRSLPDSAVQVSWVFLE